jgi:type I restriction enzyme S subunit
MSEDATLNEFIDSNPDESEEGEKPELIKGVAWSTIEYLPDEWMVNNVESDINILSGNNFSSEYFVEEGGIPLIRIRDLAEDKTTVNFDGDYDSRYLINQQDLLVGMDGEFEPHLWTGPQALLNQRVCKIEPESQYNKIFFRYAIEKPLFYIKKSIAGTTVKHLSQSNINDLNLPTPPRPEQRKIATVLYTVDQAIQKTEETIKHTERLRKALLNDLLVSGYSENRTLQEGYVGPRKVEYPHDWISVELGELTDKITKGKTPTSYGYEYTNSGINFVKVESISDHGSIDESEFDFIGQDAHDHLSGSALQEGDILFSIAGALGKVTQASENILPANTNQALALIRIDNSRVIPEYIRYYLETTLIQKYIQSIATTTAQSNLNLKQVSEFKILLPEINEQKKILQVIKTIEDNLQCEYSQKEQYKRLKRGLMQDLLSGTVRTTDTNIQVPDKIAQHG